MTSPQPDQLVARIAELSLEEKAALTAGYDSWTVPGIDALGVPPLRMTDGPNGARGALNSLGQGAVRAVCVPTGTGLAASFDPELIEQIGALLGREARQKRARVLLAPTINLVRSPLYGRSFETYGEDPWLAGTLAAAFVTGVQSEGVATTPKHLVGNEAEFQRTTINSVMSERTLREVYLLPFEFAIRRGGSLGIMTSYNQVNGRYPNEDGDLLNGIIRGEWGFEGFFVSDWFAAGTTAGSLASGLDIQMPGPDRFYGAPVAKAIANGEAAEADLDAVIKRRIHLHDRLDASGHRAPSRSQAGLRRSDFSHDLAGERWLVTAQQRCRIDRVDRAKRGDCPHYGWWILAASSASQGSAVRSVPRALRRPTQRQPRLRHRQERTSDPARWRVCHRVLHDQ